jgi:hypothetical protein
MNMSTVVSRDILSQGMKSEVTGGQVGGLLAF